MGYKLGFSIGPSTAGYGLSLPHYGTIVVGPSNRIGNYAVLHVSTSIVNEGSEIGHNFFLSTGAIITKKIKIGDNVTIAANSIVNKSLPSNVLAVGNPAIIKKENNEWFSNIIKFRERIEKIERYKRELRISLD